MTQLKHKEKTEDEWTKRSAAVHWFEGEVPEGHYWTVAGIHWRWYKEDDSFHFETLEYVADCSIYDGWWDWPGN